MNKYQKIIDYDKNEAHYFCNEYGIAMEVSKDIIIDELQERINKAIEYMIKQRDAITDYVHQAKEINEDYLFLDRTSLETFKNIYKILKGENK